MGKVDRPELGTVDHTGLPSGLQFAAGANPLCCGERLWLRRHSFAGSDKEARVNSWIGVTTLVLALVVSVLLGPSHASAVELLVASEGTDQVLRYDGSTGAFLNAFVAAGSGGLSRPEFMIFGSGNTIPGGGRVLYVTSALSNQVLRYNGLTGAFIDAFVTAGSGGLISPEGLAFGPDGNLYVASGLSNEVLLARGRRSRQLALDGALEFRERLIADEQRAVDEERRRAGDPELGARFDVRVHRCAVLVAAQALAEGGAVRADQHREIAQHGR